MAANTGQGRSFTTFLVGLVLACVGIAYFTSGFGKPVFVVGLVTFVVSLFGFLKLKPLEGKPAMNASPTVMKLVGIILAAFGWGITLFGVHLTDGNAGRMVLAIVGISVSLIGIVFVLPAAFNKNAIWKA